MATTKVKSVTLGVAITVAFATFALFLYAGWTNDRADVRHETSPATAPASASPGFDSENLERKEHNVAAYESAVDGADPGACDDIEGDSSLRLKCSDNSLAALAYARHDGGLCTKITDAHVRNKCSDSIAFDSIVNSMDAAKCGNLLDPNTKAACVRTITFAKIESASYSGGYSICDSLGTNADKQYCQTRISSTSSAAVATKAILSKNSDECRKIAAKELATSCQDAVTLQKAIEAHDRNACLSISDGKKREKCLAVTRTASDAEIYREAVLKNDKSACSKILGAALKLKCDDFMTFKAAATSGTSSSCSSISDASLKKQCELATSTGSTMDHK